MIAYLERFFHTMRPAFSRARTFRWFMVVFVGFVLRTDTLGVSSVMRALFLAASGYPCLLHFFHSTAWEADSLMQCWWRWVLGEGVAQRVNERLVTYGDHTNVPKDGQRMPHVTTLHQTSETASKPSFFRGHCWAFVTLLVPGHAIRL